MAIEQQDKTKISLDKNIFSKETMKEFKAKCKKAKLCWKSCWIIYVLLRIHSIYNSSAKYDYWFYKPARHFPFDADTVYKVTTFLRDEGYILKVKNPGHDEYEKYPKLELFCKENFEKRKNISICFYKVLFIRPKTKEVPEYIPEIENTCQQEPINEIDIKIKKAKAKEAFRAVLPPDKLPEPEQEILTEPDPYTGVIKEWSSEIDKLFNKINSNK